MSTCDTILRVSLMLMTASATACVALAIKLGHWSHDINYSDNEERRNCSEALGTTNCTEVFNSTHGMLYGKIS